MLSGLGLNLPEIKATEVLKKISKINKKSKWSLTLTLSRGFFCMI
jgi:hypothetical protein